MGVEMCGFGDGVHVWLGLCFCSGYRELEGGAWSISREGMVGFQDFYVLGEGPLGWACSRLCIRVGVLCLVPLCGG